MEKYQIAAVGVAQSEITDHTIVEYTMTVKVEVKSKFKVNGKEYASREEMPENIRAAYDKALASARRGDSASLGAPTTKIIFNGQEYSSEDSMPADVRQTYEEVLRTALGGETADSGLPRGRTRLAETILTHHGHTDWAFSDKAIEPGSSAFSSQRLLLIGFLVLALLTALYLLFRSG
jgi:hypothetical protein